MTVSAVAGWRSGRLAQWPVGAVAGAPPVPRNSLYEKQLTAPADRRVRNPAHAVAFSTGVAAGYDRSGPGSPPPSSPSQNRPPTSPVNHMRCSADHRPAWRCDAGPDVRRAVRVCMMKRARAARSAPHLTSTIWQGTLCPKKQVNDLPRAASGSTNRAPTDRAAARMAAFRRSARQRRHAIRDSRETERLRPLQGVALARRECARLRPSRALRGAGSGISALNWLFSKEINHE